MTSSEIFEYKDYRDYLKGRLKVLPTGGWGARVKLAKAIPCQVGYLSQVLNGKADFSIQQAYSVNQFLSHNDEESHFLMLLLQLERSGSHPLKKYFQTQIDSALGNRQILKNRFKNQPSFSDENQQIYFSKWYYAAIHAILSIPKFQTKESLIRLLNLSPKIISSTLDFLTQSGLANKVDDKFIPINTSFHLSDTSPLITQHHVNWRTKSINSITSDNKENLHYSSVVTLSQSDYFKIKNILISNIAEIKKIISGSPPEIPSVFSLDFFDLSSSTVA